MTLTVDLNADMGESFGPWVMGDDLSLLGIVTSANIACGGHAGDAETMFATLQEAASRGVSIDSDIVPSVQRSRLMEQQGSPVGQSDESTPNATGSAIAEGGEQ